MAKEELNYVYFEKLRQKFEREFPVEMGILRIGGVYPGKEIAGFRNPYTGEAENEYFGNVGEHCLAVANCAEVIATNHLGPDNLQTKGIVRRALVHDSTKRFEVLRKKAVKAGVIDDAFKVSSYAVSFL